jgi:hypothetical protein
LLVAGFDIFGTAGHQLSTRLYMDLLRVESELQFLAFFPPADKINMYQHWYRGSGRVNNIIELIKDLKLARLPNIEYKTSDPKTEFYIMLNKHLGGAQKYVDYINLCTTFPKRCQESGLQTTATVVEQALRRLSDIEGEITDVFPNITFLRVKIDGTLENDLVYTIVRNKSYLNTASLTAGENTRIKSEDTIDIVKGFVGAYPNFFLEIDYTRLDDFISQYASVDSYDAYHALVDSYGIRRTNTEFWKSADWFYAKHQYDNNVYAGLFDLGRYKNR